MSKGFPITSVCRNDIIQMIDEQMDDGDDLKKTLLIRKVEKITDEQMRAMGCNLSDDFCNCCFWSSLKHEFESVVLGRYNGS